MIIDTHAHPRDEKRYKEYKEKSKGRIEKILVLSCCFEQDLNELLEFVSQKDDLFMVGSVDMNTNIEKQVKDHEKLFQDKKIFGIKLYPGYQYFYPSDKVVYPIAELCQKYNKPLIFHSGDVWNPEKNALLKYTHPIHVDALAVAFPKCKIIISHLGFPNHLEAANVVSKNDNVYSDVSGTLDACGTTEEADNLIEQYVADLKRIIAYFPDLKNKLMFGSDFSGDDTPLNEIEPYIKTVEAVFDKETQEKVFHQTAEKLFFE
ncbi:amidohydrolase family protein [Patescibacteria group bacterium]